MLISCVSLRITTEGYVAENKTFNDDAIFYLEPITVTSSDIFELKEIGYIMDKKLGFALASSDAATSVLARHGSKEGADFIIKPELIIKNYEVKYKERNYYNLSVKIQSGQHIVCHFHYEYNGTASIFDGKVQNALIKKFIDDFKGCMKK
jgi:hypothetical protein